MSTQGEPRHFATGSLEQRGRKPRKFDGMEPRQFAAKAWPPDKPPGGKPNSQTKDSAKHKRNATEDVA